MSEYQLLEHKFEPERSNRNYAGMRPPRLTVPQQGECGRGRTSPNSTPGKRAPAGTSPSLTDGEMLANGWGRKNKLLTAKG